MLRVATAVVLAVLTAACNKSDDTAEAPAQAKTEAEPAAATEPAATTEPAQPAAAPAEGEVVAAVLGPYETIREALVADQGAPVAAAAGKLAGAARAAEGAAADELDPHLAELATKADELAKVAADDLAAMRLAFGEVSRAMVALVEAAPEQAESVHVFECPMASGYKRWVQGDGELANPYMGQSMPACGSEVSAEAEAGAADEG